MPEWIWVVVVIAILFGASRLPMLGRNVGSGIKEFKKGIAETHDTPKVEPRRSGERSSDADPTPLP